jgi:AraC-like DNA-binding protein
VSRAGLNGRREQARISRPAIFGEPELLHATYVTHRFPRHTHDGYGFGVIERGALGFRYRGEQVVATAGSINLVVPDEPHTGEAASEVGWTYRMFYLRADLMEAANRALAGPSSGLPTFRPGVIQDAALAGRLVRLHRDLEERREPLLAVEARLLGILRCLILRHGSSRGQGEAERARFELERARAFIRAEHARDVRLAEVASVSGLSPWHLARAFTRAFGIPPHAYQVQVRVGEARRLLARGCGVAAVAAATGFTDQSHLTRHFKRLTGLTPGRYRKNVQD